MVPYRSNDRLRGPLSLSQVVVPAKSEICPRCCAARLLGCLSCKIDRQKPSELSPPAQQSSPNLHPRKPALESCRLVQGRTFSNARLQSRKSLDRSLCCQ